MNARKQCLIVLLSYCMAICFYTTGFPEQSSLTFSYSDKPSKVLLEYTQEIGEIEVNDPIPRFRMYGDGRIVVHNPFYMKKPGDYVMYLSKQEVDDLLNSLLEDGLMEFDSRQVRQLRQASEESLRQQTDTLFAVSDITVTIIKVYLEKYMSSSTGEQLENVQKIIKWNDVQTDARMHSDVIALQGLAKVEQKIQAFLKDTRLVKIDK